MVGARHIIQRQFVHGFDFIDDETDDDNDDEVENMYLMEFMLVMCPIQSRTILHTFTCEPEQWPY